MSTVKRGDKLERPDWDYPASAERLKATVVTQLDILEMLESIRNVLEEVRDRLPRRRKKEPVTP